MLVSQLLSSETFIPIMILFKPNEILNFLQDNQEQNTGCQNKHCLEAEGTSFSHHWSGKGKGNGKDKRRKKLIENSIICLSSSYIILKNTAKDHDLFTLHYLHQ